VSEKTHGWCDHCREEVPVNSVTGNCLWCDAPARVRKRRKVAKAKPGDGRLSRITEERARVLHRLHVEKDLSINEMADRVWEQLGYASKSSCASAIHLAFKRHGLKAQDRIEMTRKKSTKHGLAPKHGPRPGYGTYKRKVIHGIEDRPRCVGTTFQGGRCDRPALLDSEFCDSHDPRFADRRAAHLAVVRDSRWEGDSLVAVAPLTAWLKAKHCELGSWREVGRLVDRSVSLVHCYGRGLSPTSKKPLDVIHRSTVEGILESAGVAFDEVYGLKAAA